MLIEAGLKTLECREPLAITTDSAPVEMDALPHESREAARQWIMTAVDLLEDMVDSDAIDETIVAKKVRELRTHAVLADFRDAAKIARLPDDERRSWERIWKKVGELE